MRVLASGTAFLVDMDGTLVDSTAVVEAVWREFSAAHGLDPADVLPYAHGRQTVATISHFLPGLDAAEHARLAAAFQAEETGRTDGVAEVPDAALAASVPNLVGLDVVRDADTFAHSAP